MASPPPFAHSLFSQHTPPYPPNIPDPRSQNQKRRQTDMASTAPTVKRRKASMLSTTSASSNHPLRQTSFPPENDSAIMPRSPSVDTMSVASASVAGGPKKKRGRKSKKELGDDESTVGGKAKSEVSGIRGSGKRKQSITSADEEEEGGEEMALEMEARSAEEKKKELEHRALLVNNLDRDQFERYEAWRGCKLSEATVRRIVNQTLSQSVPANVIMAIRSVAKVYAGDMIESARQVQAQWNYSDEELKEKIKENMENMPVPPTDIAPEVMNEEKRLPAGPLLPKHLREAHRRHKASREGGSVGQMNLWHIQAQTGVERFATKAGGKRLFK